MKQNKVGLIIISTGKYDRFIQPLVNSMDKHFFAGDEFDVYLLSDNEYLISYPERVSHQRFHVPHLPFPLPTLNRYKWITQYSDSITAKNLFYMDVDMLFVGSVGDEIRPNGKQLVATYHPGFYMNDGWGDNDTHPLSRAYLHPKMRTHYYAGGFQGGERKTYLEACGIMAMRIEEDFEIARTIDFTKNNGILARWHDESHWNCYLKYGMSTFKSLTPEYCMAEQIELRKKWKIDNLIPKIIALEKDHNKLRT